MRKALLFLAVLVPVVAVAAGLRISSSVQKSFTNCSSSGSAAQTVSAGTYLLRTFDEDVWICQAATCGSGGDRYAAGTVIVEEFVADTSVSCRSSSSTGDAVFTAVY